MVSLSLTAELTFYHAHAALRQTILTSFPVLLNYLPTDRPTCPLACLPVCLPAIYRHSRPPEDPDAPWLCDECELRMHRCFICKEYSLDEGEQMQ